MFELWRFDWTVADWWAIELGRKLKSYKSLVNGNIEHGFNPRKLEAIYIKRSKKHFKTYWTVPWLGIIRKLPSPVNPVGYAKILTDRKSEEVMDPTIPGVRFNLKPNDYPMEHMWKSVFDGKKKHKTSLLIDAIRNHGPVLSQLELDHARFLPGAHTPAIIGYGILKKGFPKRVVFIVHDSYGDHPKDYKQDARGGSLYRYVPSKMIDEAIVFPHVVRVSYKTVSNQLVLAFHNSGNVPVKVNKVMLKDKSGKIINLTIRKRKSKLVVPFSKLPGNFNTSSFIVYVDADYYRGKDGNGYWIKPKKL